MSRMTVDEMAAAWISDMETDARVAGKLADRAKAEEITAWAASESHWSRSNSQVWLRASTRRGERAAEAARARVRADNVAALLADYTLTQPVRRSA